MEKENLKSDSGEIEKVIKGYEEYAKKNGFKLNPNRQIVKAIAKGLLEREKTYGFRYCPCRRVTGNKEEDEKLICPCFWSREEIEKQGYCVCRLFSKT